MTAVGGTSIRDTASVQVRVVAISAADRREVRLATSAGEIQARWVGQMPTLGQVEDVELDIDDGDFVLDVNIFDLSRDVPVPDDPSMIQGTVEGETDDDVITLKIAGGLVMIRAETATARALQPGAHVALPIRNARAYPTGI